jgi:hypothetical protein
MPLKEQAPGQGETRRFLVKCDGCSFERPAEGRDEATEIGDGHRRETGHELVAVEFPPAAGSS